jgi:spoIIIJ-associated protein
MKEMKIEGKSIDEAIENACSAFQVPREKLNIEIISEGSAGFLGIGAKKAQIRASLLVIDLMIDDDPVPRQSVEPEALESPVIEPVRTRPERGTVRVPPVSHRKEAVRREEQRGDEPARAARPAFSGTVEGGESAKEKAKRVLEGLLTRMQVDSTVSAEETEEAIILNIQGNESGFLIGKRGQNLDAIQYIVSKAVHHSVNGDKMIIIDTEKYRERREESLIALAIRIGEKVKKTKKPLTIGYMNAHDRRVIHLAIQNDPTLTTKSRGEGDYRKILILSARRRLEAADA